MSTTNPTAPPAIHAARATLQVEPTRVRQTERPATPFREVLANGVDVLMAGVQTAGGLVGGPVLAAAVHEARSDVHRGLAPSGEGLQPGLDSAHAMQRESQAFNLQLLSLQEEIQQENRRFTTMSNVLRARHDTAKAAVGNIRS